jgi:nicotinate-nucleotide--dimethylbenzimidazole phosphoribosyltransferase
MKLLHSTIEKITDLDYEVMDSVKYRIDNLAKPVGSLGDLEEYAIKISGIKSKMYPSLGKKVVMVMAGDHKIIEEGVALSPKEITRVQAVNMTKGLTGVCAVSKQCGAEVVVVDVGIDADLAKCQVIDKKIRKGSGNFANELAMTRDEAIKALEVGIETSIEQIKSGAGILATGEMGIGNTTPSSAIVAVMCGVSASETTGRGANLPMDRLENKITVIENAIKKHNPNSQDPIDVLSKVGGLEIAAMAGVMLAGAAYKVPVIIDGFISWAAAIIACGLNPLVSKYLFASHISVERGAVIASEKIGIKPCLDLNLRLGEGSGAALMFNILEVSLSININMATYYEAGFTPEGEL